MIISAEQATIPTWLTAMLAIACGLVGANLYYAQPLAGPIGAALGMSPGSVGLIVTLTQIGYGIGLLLIVPLADLVENRRLVVVLLGASAAALLAAARCPPIRCRSCWRRCASGLAASRCRCWCPTPRTWCRRHGAAGSSATC